MSNEMIKILRDEFAQEVPATRETLAAWQANPDVPPPGVADMLSLLGRFAQAVETVGLDGLALYLHLVGQFTEGLLASAEQAFKPAPKSEEEITKVALSVIWLAGWVDETNAYLESPAHPLIVEHMAAYLKLCPLVFEEDLLLDVASRLLVQSPAGGFGDDEFEPLEPATDADVTLATQDLDPELLAALLADAPQQLQVLEDAVQRWTDGQCSAAEMLEAQRSAHTFKGSGYIIGLPGIGVVAHRLEDVLEHAVAGIRAGDPAPPAMARDVMQAVYCLHHMLDFVQGVEAAPANSRAVLQRLLDWVGWIRAGEAAMADPEPLLGTAPASSAALSAAIAATPTLAAPALRPAAMDLGDVAHPTMPAAASIQPEPATLQAADSARARDSASLRVQATQLSQLLRRAGQSIIHSERLANLLLDTESWLAAMDRNNQILGNRLRELDLMVNTQVVQLREAQEVGVGFDPLEMDRYDALHGLSRFISEAARDSAELVQQARHSANRSSAILRDESYALVDQHHELLAVRMVSVKTVVPRLKRIVAQTASATGRKVNLQVAGEDVMMDADVLNRLVEPLLHLLRNAVDHGIELPQDRAFAGKPEHGTIELSFQSKGSEVLLQVIDDGRGLDLIAIESKALAFGLIKTNGQLSEAQLQRLILAPGFSTREAVTETSGRGVGMDVVNDRITGLKGRLDIESTAGVGSRFAVHVPVTSGVAQALVVQCGTEPVALPQEQVLSIVPAGLAPIEIIDGRVVATHDGQHYPAFALAQWLRQDVLTAEEILLRAPQWLVVLAYGATGMVALLVDQVLESRELILQDVGRLTRRVPGVIGGALRADGRPLFLVGVPELERAAQQERRTGVSAVMRKRLEVQRTLVLVVDDAWSVRRSMEQLLQDAGFEVVSAADGFEALDRLRARKPALVITDLEMPNLNGLELTRRMREIPQWAGLPVVMITSRTSEKHRAEASKVGVDVYLTKPYQDETLLATVRELCSTEMDLELA
jgi:chemotaxis protein histidine kinase CheA/ActR/RegA family two-component response regulator